MITDKVRSGAAGSFSAFYRRWLAAEQLEHGSAARERFAAAFPLLCGHDPALFHRGYERYREPGGLADSADVFASYCAPRWRVFEVLRRRVFGASQIPHAVRDAGPRAAAAAGSQPVSRPTRVQANVNGGVDPGARSRTGQMSGGRLPGQPATSGGRVG